MGSGVYIISRIYNSGTLAGFMLYDANRYESRAISYQQLVYALNNGAIVDNAEIKDGKLRGISGSLNRYTAITTNGNLLTEPSLVVIKRLKGSDGVIRYRFVDYKGLNVTYLYSDLSKLKNIKLANAKMLKSTSGEYYISAIEGQISTSDDNDISKCNMQSSRHKKFELFKPDFNDPYIKSELSKIRSKARYSNGIGQKLANTLKQDWIEKSKIPLKDGIEFYTYSRGKEKVTSAFNEVLSTMELKSDGNPGESIRIGITGIKVGEDRYFALKEVGYGNDPLLVQDILYIGDSWVRMVGDKKAESYSYGKDNRIICAGLVGLLIIWEFDTPEVQRLYKNKATEIKVIEGSLHFRCIPYDQINSIQKLTKKLVELGIGSDILSKSDLQIILDVAQKCPYRFIYDVDLIHKESSIIPRLSGVTSDDYDIVLLNSCIINREQLTITRKDNLVFYQSMAPTHLNSSVMREASYSVLLGDYVIFNQIRDETIIAYYYDVSFGVSLNRELKINHDSVLIKHLGYMILSINGKVGEIPSVWISEEFIKTRFKSVVWHYEIEGDKLYLFISDNRIVMSIPSLITRYNKDIEEFNNVKKASKKVNMKMQMIGTQAKLDDLGRVCGWQNGTVIEQTNRINGIRLDSDTANNTLKFFVRGKIDFRDERSQSWRGCNIELYYKVDNFDNMLETVKLISTPGIKYGIDLSGATSEKTCKMIALLLQLRSTNTICVNGNNMRLRELKELMTLPFMIRNSPLCWSQKDIDFALNFLNDIEIVNVEKMQASERSGVIKVALSGYNRRSERGKNMSGRIIEFLIKKLCLEEERDRILNQFYEWANWKNSSV